MKIQHRYKARAIALCYILLVFLLLVSESHSNKEEKEEEEERLRNNKKNPSNNWKLPTYWEAIKMKLLAVIRPFYPLSFLPSSKPTTDFREIEKEEGGAVEKSIEKAKETIEDSAKSAANMATETLKNTMSQDEL